MNYYVVVEGKCEKKVYKKWVHFLNPGLRIANDITDVTLNSVYILSGGGYPQYFEIIEAAIEDVDTSNVFDKLIISIDAEEMTYQARYDEIDTFVQSKNLQKAYSIIVQNFCIETWALGNKYIFSRTPQNASLLEYIRLFNVLEQDPELLPPKENEQLNRSQFAEKYLRLLINEKFNGISYSKSDPYVLLNRKYFERVKRRHEDDQHINSFSDFIKAFR